MKKTSNEEKTRRTALRFGVLKEAQQMESSVTPWERLKSKARDEDISNETLGRMFRVYLALNK